MHTQLILVLLLLLAAIVMFIINRPRMDAVAIIMMVGLPLTGVMSVGEALSGFADPNVILIGAFFVIGESLVRTGVARAIGDWLDKSAGGSETRLVALLMLAVAVLGSVSNGTAVVAIFIPIVLRISQNTGTPAARLMMPLSVAACISGMLTLVATAPNLVVNAELERVGLAGFSFFSITPFGVAALIVGVVYMVFARRFLPVRETAAGKTTARPTLRDWVSQYALADRERRASVSEGSPLIGQSLEELALRQEGFNLLAIERRGSRRTELIRPLARTRIQAGDVLFVDTLAADQDTDALARRFGVTPMPVDSGAAYFTDRSQELGMLEVILPSESRLVGHTVREARFRSESGLNVIGVRRGRTPFGADLLDEKLAVGDTLLLTGFWSDIDRLQADRSDFVLLNMPREMEEILPVAGRAPYAIGILVIVIVMMVTGVVPNAMAALIGCLLMGLFGCIDMPSAYHGISWKSLLLIVGMLPFSIALQRTGAVDIAANALVSAVGNASPRLVLGSLFVITAIIGLFISNTATAVLMGPVGIAVAKDLSASPYTFAMIIMLASSASFMTPISTPINTLVVAPGNYEFGDFVRVGVPLAILILVLSVLLVPLLLPFR
ncbi:MAG: SLC13 family permease [Acetobacteraceae bacterium]